MEMYFSNHPGRTVTAAEITSLALSNDNVAGYFLKATIEQALEGAPDKPDGAVRPGIRIYRAKDVTRPLRRRVLAIAVKPDGFDDVPFSAGRSWLSSKQVIPGNDAEITDPPGNEAMTFNAAFGEARHEELTAFFSREMLQPLLDDSTAEGICFYEVQLDALIGSGTPLLGGQPGFRSYLAVATSPNADSRILHDTATPTNSVLSDQPCPGVCLNLQPTIATTANLELNLNAAPYLFPWEKT